MSTWGLGLLAYDYIVLDILFRGLSRAIIQSILSRGNDNESRIRENCMEGEG